MRPPGSLRARIALCCVAAIAVALAGMGVAAYAVVAHELGSSLDLGLRREATRIDRTVATDADVATASGPCRYLTAPSCVQVVAADGRIESEHDPNQPLPVDARTRAVAAGTAAAFFSDVELDGYRLRMYTAPLRSGAAVQVAQRADPVDTSLRRVGYVLLAAAAGGTVLAVAAGFAVARRAVAPVTTLTAAAERVADTRDPRHPIAVTGPAELRSLASSFNTMLDQLDQALTAERESRAAQHRLIADASHELRTPLTALRTNIDLLHRASSSGSAQLAETATVLRNQSDELSGLVTDLIDLARADDPSAAPELFEDVRLDLLVLDCRRTAQRHWPAITFESDVEPTTVHGAPARLVRAVTNLLDNAAKFSPAQGVVHLRLRDGELTVRDHGPGIAPEDLPHVFDRFYRSATARARPGHGLGLAIVAQVARSHGATVTAGPAPGGGAEFRLVFPRRA
ncbi:two-component system sensor histidine kinase MprB [Nocardia tenerifensis]|uniref:histidine kinase n=1 Tax=Nocardia tenerifensis TaxID=228006 RepID=A0A318JNF0_9NOCA|nr:sensor histidine kinase [Nocardia tenerifensis]PXX52858.1 two-component system sensor histidine kinase MprB [Nocardia tenerifensis]